MERSYKHEFVETSEGMLLRISPGFTKFDRKLLIIGIASLATLFALSGVIHLNLFLLVIAAICLPISLFVLATAALNLARQEFSIHGDRLRYRSQLFGLGWTRSIPLNHISDFGYGLLGKSQIPALWFEIHAGPRSESIVLMANITEREAEALMKAMAARGLQLPTRN